jgi:hypothetical protein
MDMRHMPMPSSFLFWPVAGGSERLADIDAGTPSPTLARAQRAAACEIDATALIGATNVDGSRSAALFRGQVGARGHDAHAISLATPTAGPCYCACAASVGSARRIEDQLGAAAVATPAAFLSTANTLHWGRGLVLPVHRSAQSR